MISKSRAILITALFLALLPLHVFASDTWISGETHFYFRQGLTGGGTALDAISGVSMCETDVAVSIDISGNTVYFHQVSVSGDESGTTTESSPYWIMPDTAGNGQPELAGVSMWKLMGITGVTGVFNALYIDNTRWDDGSGGMSESVVRAGISATVLDKATDPYLAALPDPVKSNINASRAISGASPTGLSGTSVQAMGGVVFHDGSDSKIYGLPPIPTSGVSIPYIMFAVGADGGGMTVYPTGPQPFHGDGLSGTSYCAIPPGYPWESATFFGRYVSGTCAYWFVHATGNWRAGD